MRDVLRARIVEGRVIAADIVPVRYLGRFPDPADLAPHLFEDRIPGFAETVGAGDMLVGTGSFGVGLASEAMVAALRACGVRLVAAPDFGRAFYRHCWELGVPAVRADVAAFVEGHFVGVDLAAGKFLGAAGLPTFTPPAPSLLELAEAGGRSGLPHRPPALATITPIGSARRPAWRAASGGAGLATLRGARSE